MRTRVRHWLRALLDRLIEVEVIGQAECPMMLRWQFLNLGFLKAMVHYFPPEVSDRDPHDHPRSFVTLVLRGEYRDESWEKDADRWRAGQASATPRLERLRAGSFRFRPARHLHIVETDEKGCWTVVVMGPIQREWGFVRLATMTWGAVPEWVPFKKYIDAYGGVARCDAPPGSADIFEEGQS